MKVTAITVAVARTISLGHYESAKLEVRLTAELEPGDSADEAYNALFTDARDKLYQKIFNVVE